jgi:hypothetical protein
MLVLLKKSLALIPLLVLGGCLKTEGGTRPLAGDAVDLADTAPELGSGPDTQDIFHENEPVWARLEVPVTETWRALVGGESGDWLVLAGDRGAVLGYEAGAWAYMNLGTQEHLRGIKAEGPEDFVVCGTQGALWRRKSSGPGQPSVWEDLSAAWFSKELLALDGPSLDELWVGGVEGTLLHVFSGLLLKLDPGVLGLTGEVLPDITGVLMVDGQPMILAGDRVLRLAGEDWVLDFKTANGELLVAISQGAGEVWVGGAKGSVFVKRGNTWATGSGPIYFAFDSLWADPLGTLFATGKREGGEALVWFGDETGLLTIEVASPDYVPEALKITKPFQVTGLWGASAESLFACTDNGQLLHYAIH